MTDVLARPVSAPARLPRPSVALLGLGTAVPASATLAQSIEIAQRLACQTDGQRAWLERVFSRAGIQTRGSVLVGPGGLADVHDFYPAPRDASDRGPTTAARMQRYAHEAPLLATSAASNALADAGLEPGAITHLITTSCTGFFAPGLDVALIQRLGLSPAVQRRHLGFMGCHAAFNALAAAREAVMADSQARVLVCATELSTLHFAYGWDPEKLVANALFADGSSACVVGSPRLEGAPRASWRLLQTASLLLPSSSDAMTWRIGDHGFEMTLSAELPALIRGHLAGWCADWLGREGLSISEISHWALHPGGPKILDACRGALALDDRALGPSRAVLARQGNMSSATLLFLLQEIARQQPAPGYCVAIGFGPGLMAEGLLLEI